MKRLPATLSTVLGAASVSSSGWMPFFDPINWFHGWWFLLALPLAFLISMTYKAMRYRLQRKYWSQVSIMTIQILLGMFVMLLGLFVLVEWIVPLTSRG